jgi:hypothetical protein
MARGAAIVTLSTGTRGVQSLLLCSSDNGSTLPMSVRRLALCLVGGVGGPTRREHIAVDERVGDGAKRHDDQHAPHREVVGRHGSPRHFLSIAYYQDMVNSG